MYRLCNLPADDGDAVLGEGGEVVLDGALGVVLRGGQRRAPGPRQVVQCLLLLGRGGET